MLLAVNAAITPDTHGQIDKATINQIMPYTVV